MAINFLSSSRRARLVATAAIAAAGLASQTMPVYAQIDPTLFLKRSAPNIILAVDTSNRMERNAPTDNTDRTTSLNTSSYYDPFIYSRTGAGYENTLQVSDSNTNAVGTGHYRRKYSALSYFTTSSTISIVGDKDTNYSTFEATTRLAIARAAMYQAVKQNQNVARFGLLRMRQQNPSVASQIGGVVNTDASQSGTNATDDVPGSWKMYTPTVGGVNGAQNSSGLLIQADSNTANADVLAILNRDIRQSDVNTAHTLLPAGRDVGLVTVDAPVKYMLDDAASEADRLIAADNSNGSNGQQCRNTVVILIVGGSEGTTTPGATESVIEAKAASFLTTWAGRHVPIYVIAIAPPASDRTQLQNVASMSGGMYFEVTKAEIDAALNSTMWAAATLNAKVAGSLPDGSVEVPEVVRAINLAIQAAFENFADLNTASTATWQSGAGVPPIAGDFKLQTAQLVPGSEFQVTTPIIGTVNLTGGKDINGATLLPDPLTVIDRANNVIPQRSNVMVTASFGLPGFDGRIRALRMYKAVPDSTQPSGWKFQSDLTALWVGCAPGTTDTGPCGPTNFPSSGSVLGTDSRNLYTTDANGNMVAFTVANVNTLAPLMNLNTADATNVIKVVRSQPLGTILDSTPAIMNPPSLDPPPDDTYPAFAVANKDRRAIVWVGTNRGVFEAIDARLGVEVWGYIPMNLLPKLRTLWDGQAVGSTDFMMDGSPKISDIKLADGTWRTYMFLSEGAGGTFYQTFDVTMANMSATVAPDDDVVAHTLSFFSTGSIVPLKWSFPSLASWDPTFSSTLMPWGDLKSSALTVEKTVGQTWSDPAIGQVVGPSSPYVMLAGSGYLPYSVQIQSNRGGVVAGTTFYMFNAETGALLDSKSVGSDGTYETQDNCANTTNPSPTPGDDCRYFKNALHSDPVATGPADSRFVTKAYIGDLDGRLWRFDIQLNATTGIPEYIPGTSNPTMLYSDALKQPIFASMATVNVGGTQQYIFTGTGSDLLPSDGVSEQYRLLGILDNGTTGTLTFEIDLEKVDTSKGDEKVTTFPAVAGDIVFFTTNTFNPLTPCTLPTASLYALTFIGGPAYDTNNDGKFNNSDSVLVKSISGARGTAPFIVDQHLVFGTAGQIQIFGSDTDYNNGIGQAGVRILSWREVR